VTQKKRDLGKVYNKEFSKTMQEFDGFLSSNLGNLNPDFLKNYKNMKQQMATNYLAFTKPLVEIGQLQILRKLVCQQIFFSARVESNLYQSCLETLNYTVLHNLDEIRDTAKRTFVDKDEELANMNSETLN